MTLSFNIAKKNWANILFVLIFIASLTLKISLVDKYRVSGDEGISVAASKSILKNGVPKLHSGIYPRDPLYHYLLAAAIGVFGDGKLAVRGISLLFSQLSLILVFFFCKRYINTSTALAMVCFMALSRSYNAQALNARMYATAQFFCLAGVFAYYKAYFEKQDSFKLVAVISCLCAAFSHKISFPVIGSLLIFHLMYDYKSALKDKYAYLLLFVLIFAYIFTSKIKIFAGPEVNYKTAQAGGLSLTEVKSSINLAHLLISWQEMLNRFIPYSAYIFLTSIYFYFFQNRKKLYMLLWVVFMLPFVFVSLFAGSQFRYYWTEITFFALLIITFLDYLVKTACAFSKETIAQKNSLKTKKLIISACCFLLLGTVGIHVIGWDQVRDRVTYPFVISEDFKYDSEPAFNFLAQNIKPSDVVITVDPPLNYFYKLPIHYFLREKIVSATEWGTYDIEKDSYFGPVILDSIEEFETVLRTHPDQNIWIFANEKYQWAISDKMRDWIEKRFKLVFDKDYEKDLTYVFYLDRHAKNTLGEKP